MSKQIAKNTFTGGLLMDSNPLSSQNTVLTNALNATLVTIDGDEMILQNDMGNLKVTYTNDKEGEVDVTLTPGFIPIGINTLNGIAYIVSFNPESLEGEIGTFPSPQYNLDGDLLIDDSNENDKLINKYQPLYNLYKGPVGGEKLKPKQEKIERLLWAMRTTHFNFDLEHPVNIELLPSYDGSVNIIINDGKNIPRLINSRFSAKEDGTWEIPDRHRNINNIYKVYDDGTQSSDPDLPVDPDDPTPPAPIPPEPGPEPEPEPEGLQWIDMGTSVLWANINYESPDIYNYGSYNTWAYTDDLYKTPWSYAVESGTDSISESVYDIIYRTYGNGARTPHYSEFLELFNATTQEPVIISGIQYYRLTSKTTRNTLLFPYGGYETSDGEPVGQNEHVYMWSSDISGESPFNPILVRWTAAGPIERPNILTLRAPIRGVKPKSSVKPKPDQHPENVVDLGLSVNWSNVNLGASTETERGSNIQWACTTEPEGNDYSKDSYKFYKNGKYLDIGKDFNSDGTYVNDAARQQWGGTWRVPTERELSELWDKDKCTWVWTTKNSVDGVLITSKINGNSIFLPAAGWKTGKNGNLIHVNSYGQYWSSSLNLRNTDWGLCLLIQESMSQDDILNVIPGTYREHGLSIRPVCERTTPKPEPTPEPEPDPENDYVDLGLSVKWGKWNIGATNEDLYGGYYGWGDETGENYSPYDNHYALNFTHISGTEHDIAKAKLGGNWRLPTKEEFEELINNATWEHVSDGVIQKYKLTFANGNSIYLPYYSYATHDGEVNETYVNHGYYWTGDAPEDDVAYRAYALHINSYRAQSFSEAERCLHLFIRPVYDDRRSKRLLKKGIAYASIQLKATKEYKEPMCSCDGDEILNGISNSECGCDSISCEQEIKNLRIFDITTALNKRVNSFPIIKYQGVLNTGNLPVGNYTLYFKYCDEDGNETDFIAESGIISIFKGNDSDPFSIDGGERDMDSNKSIRVQLKYIDPAYSFIKVYYSRTSAAADENRISQAFEIVKTYPTSHGGSYKECDVIINGDEEKQQIPITDLSLQLTIVNSAESLVLIGNRLFFGNIESLNLFYKDLTDLSLNVVPYVKRELSKDRIGEVNASDYTDENYLSPPSFRFNYEYYNTKNIYYNVGYWNEEYYRLGIVYIFEDGSLSPVFNTLGYETSPLNVIDEKSSDISKHFNSIDYIVDSEKFTLRNIEYYESGIIKSLLKFIKSGANIDPGTLNAKGVIRIVDDEIEQYDVNIFENPLNKSKETDYTEDIPGKYLYKLGVYLNSSLINELKNKYCILGFFIVRQKRIPTILAQGFTMPWDKEAKVPIIEYWGLRHDFYRGLYVSESGNDDGIKYSDIYPISRNLYLSPKLSKLYLGIKRRCDVVESFLQQNAADAFGMANPKDLNKSDTDHDETWDKIDYSRGCSIHHEYLQRLHQILPLAIDDELIHKETSINKDKYGYKPTTFLIDLSGTWYEKEGDTYELISTPSGYDGELSGSYDDNEAINKLNQYVSAIGDYMYMGSEDTEEESGEGVITIKHHDYYLKITTINCRQGSENIELKYNNKYCDRYELILDPLDSSLYEFRGYEINNVLPVITKGIRREESSEQEDDSDILNNKFKADDYLGHGYSTIDCYYSGAIVSRLTGEIWERPINEDDRVFTALNNKLKNDVPLTYMSAYYMNRLLNQNEIYRIDSDNYRFSKRLKDRFEGVTAATKKHLYDLYKYCDKQQLTAICPEFEVRQPFFNQLFTGATYKVKYNKYQSGILHRSTTNERYYYQDKGSECRLDWEITHEPELSNYDKCSDDMYCVTDRERACDYFSYNMAEGVWLLEGNYADYTVRPYKIVSVTDSVPVVAIDNTIFKSVLGSEQEAYRFGYINEEHCPKRAFKHFRNSMKDNKILCNTENLFDFNLVRGYYSPYLGMICSEHGDEYNKYNGMFYWDNEKGRGYGRNFTIYDESYGYGFESNANIRIQDSSPYYPISERIAFDINYSITDVNGLVKGQHIKYDLYRGDCFLYTFTHRLNRNFNDPTAPTNDHIINPTTWRDHYRPDDTDTSEEGTTELSKINRGDVNAVKLGSWITVKGRSSYNLSIRSLDERYTTEAAMMGRARGFYPLQQASADGGYKIPNSYLINDGFGSTVGEKLYNTLPDAPYYNNHYEDRIVYSDVNIQDAYKNGYRTFKSSSITDYTKQYGKIVKLVDWYSHIICVFEHAVGILPINERIESGEGIGGPVFIDNNKVLPDTPSMISDKFGSQWKDSIIKTPYAIYGVDTSTKKIWKITGSTTLPTLTVISDFKIENFLKENLPTVDNDLSTYIAIRNVKTHYNLTKSDVMFTFYTDKESVENRLHGDNKENLDEYAWSICLNEITSDLSSQNSGNFVTFYSWIPLESFNLNNKFYSFDREMVRGILSFPNFELVDSNDVIDYIGKPLYRHTSTGFELVPSEDINYCNPTEDLYAPKYIFDKYCGNGGLNLWEHNNPFIRPLPTHWYGKQHPFEFEFVAIEDPSVQKIWEDLKIISNNAEPESFHFSISGDNYEFTEDIPNIYYRQEATKELYSKLGCKMSYNKDYLKIHPNQQIKSTIFPLYYNRIDAYDSIYDLYQQMTDGDRDYLNLSGTEVVRNPRSRKFELTTHIKNTPINGLWVRLTPENYSEYILQEKPEDISFEKFFDDIYNEYYFGKYPNNIFTTKECYKIKKEKKPKNAFLCGEEYWYYIWVQQSRLKGNSHYKEDKWNILIPTITLMQKNENRWLPNSEGLEVPNIVINQPPKLDNYEVTPESLPNTFNMGQISTDKWTFRKEAKMRDKYCKIKVRYSGEELAIISAILTTFNISYA